MTAVTLNGRSQGFVSGKTNPSVWTRLSSLFGYRRILALLVRRDVKVQFAGSALGWFWTILEPLLTTFVFWALFTQILHRDAGPEFRPYMLYLVTGILPWFWFNGAVSGGAKALRAEAQMVRSSNVPRELWVLRVVVSQGVDYLFALPVVIIFALAYLQPPTIYLLLLPVAILIEFVMVFGLGLILAPLTVMFKDLDRVIPIVLRLMYYASPVLYSTTRLPQKYRKVYDFNPATGFLELTHSAFFSAAFRWGWVWHSAVFAVVVLAIGAVVFRRFERQVLKEI